MAAVDASEVVIELPVAVWQAIDTILANSASVDAVDLRSADVATATRIRQAGWAAATAAPEIDESGWPRGGSLSVRLALADRAFVLAQVRRWRDASVATGTGDRDAAAAAAFDDAWLQATGWSESSNHRPGEPLRSWSAETDVVQHDGSSCIWFAGAAPALDRLLRGAPLSDDDLIAFGRLNSFCVSLWYEPMVDLLRERDPRVDPALVGFLSGLLRMRKLAAQLAHEDERPGR